MQRRSLRLFVLVSLDRAHSIRHMPVACMCFQRYQTVLLMVKPSHAAQRRCGSLGNQTAAAARVVRVRSVDCCSIVLPALCRRHASRARSTRELRPQRSAGAQRKRIRAAVLLRRSISRTAPTTLPRRWPRSRRRDEAEADAEADGDATLTARANEPHQQQRRDTDRSVRRAHTGTSVHSWSQTATHHTRTLFASSPPLRPHIPSTASSSIHGRLPQTRRHRRQ